MIACKTCKWFKPLYADDWGSGQCRLNPQEIPKDRESFCSSHEPATAPAISYKDRLGDAYQIVGCMAFLSGLFGTDDVDRALTWLDGGDIDGEILPWPREPLAAFSLVAHLHRQRSFSQKTFGPGARTAGVLDHIRKELAEIEADPTDIKEWVDVILLAFDGAWRAGWEPEDIVKAISEKQAKNEARQWPDWRTQPADKAIEHVRAAEVNPADA